MSSRQRMLSLFVAAGALVVLAGFVSPDALQAQGRRGAAPAGDTTGPRDRFATAARGLRLRHIGPAAISGRISDVAVAPDKKTWYVGVASGGLWKTTNAGTTFSPIFDGEGS